MTPPPEGTPWWAWLLGVAIVAVVGAVGLIAVALINRKINAIGRDVVATRVQTENEHQGTEYPNMRDELTAARQAAEKAVAAAERLEQGQRRHDAEIGGVREDVRHLRMAHGETRQWVGAEAAERRALAAGLEKHYGLAAERDRLIAGLAATITHHHPNDD